MSRPPAEIVGVAVVAVVVDSDKRDAEAAGAGVLRQTAGTVVGVGMPDIAAVGAPAATVVDAHTNCTDSGSHSGPDLDTECT